MPSKKRYLIFYNDKVYLTVKKALVAMGYQTALHPAIETAKWGEVHAKFSVGRWIVCIRDKKHLKKTRRAWILLRQELEPKVVVEKPKPQHTAKDLISSNYVFTPEQLNTLNDIVDRHRAAPRNAPSIYSGRVPFSGYADPAIGVPSTQPTVSWDSVTQAYQPVEATEAPARFAQDGSISPAYREELNQLIREANDESDEF